MARTVSTKKYYSDSNRSYTGAKYASRCVGRSVWSLSLRDSGNFSESLVPVNYTGKMENNGEDVEQWLMRTRGW